MLLLDRYGLCSRTVLARKERYYTGAKHLQLDCFVHNGLRWFHIASCNTLSIPLEISLAERILSQARLRLFMWCTKRYIEQYIATRH